MHRDNVPDRTGAFCVGEVTVRLSRRGPIQWRWLGWEYMGENDQRSSAFWMIARFSLLLLILLGSFARVKAAQLEKQLPSIRVGLIEFSPLVSFDQDKPSGPLFDYAMEIFQNAGFKFSFQQVSINRSLEELKANNLDLVLTLFKSPEREAYVQFSQKPLLISAMGVCSLDDLDSKILDKTTRVAHIRGTIIAKSLQGLQLFPVNGEKSQLRMLQMLIKKRVDLIYSPKPEVILLTALDAGISQTLHCYNLKDVRLPIHIGFSKQLLPEHRARLDQSLKAMIEKEDFDVYLQKRLMKMGVSSPLLKEWQAVLKPE